jgi:hypothetical protein
MEYILQIQIVKTTTTQIAHVTWIYITRSSNHVT